jgi:hypothetical protein
MVADARVLISEGVGFAAICSNDAASYPEDSFENMKRFAKAHDFPFPYLHDETDRARSFDMASTLERHRRKVERLPMFRSTARFHASFHLIEQPIDGFWSAGATPALAIARMASTSSRDAPS